MNASPVVTVVTPVFNGAAFITECIESVLAQTLADFEYIVLDNGSNDGTRAIVERYACKDPRIVYRRNCETLPILENWNTAMRLIGPGTKYCKVVHADDMLLPECLQRMVQTAETHPSVAVIGAYRIDGAAVNMVSIPFPDDFVDGRELARRRLLGQMQDVFGSPTSVMYRADCVRKRHDFYNIKNPHADTEVCFDLLREGDYGFVHQVLTYTRRHQASETSYARAMGTHSAARLTIAREFGGYFLDAAEHARAIELQLGYHYQFLCRNVMRMLLEPEFRRYHGDLLADCGVPLSYRRLTKSAARASAERLIRFTSKLLPR